MNTNVNLAAPLGAVALLGTGFLFLQASQSAGTPLTTSLRPGASYTTDVAFDLPLDAKAVTLMINEGELLPHLVIGHENSPLHKQTKFQL